MFKKLKTNLILDSQKPKKWQNLKHKLNLCVLFVFEHTETLDFPPTSTPCSLYQEAILKMYFMREKKRNMANIIHLPPALEAI